MSDLRPRSELRIRDSSSRKVGIARHGRLRKSSPLPSILKFLAGAVAVVIVSGASIGAIAVNGVTSQATIVDIPSAKDGPLPQLAAIKGGFNILIVGSDTRDGQGGIGGTVADDSGILNDVNMLLHVSQDQKHAVAVSFPRDMVMPIPDCEYSDGSGKKAFSTEPINTTLSYGGLPCVAQTIQDFTGLKIQFAGLITFQGVISVADAIGGVPVCIDGPMVDPNTQLDLPEAGTYTLNGFQALAFLRSREAVGDGSDLTRISSQQVYLSSLVRTLKSSNTLGDVKKVYGLANSAISNMTLSSSLSSATTMAQIALALKDIPIENVAFVQYPGTTGSGGIYANKVRPNTNVGDELMQYLIDDQPFALDSAGDGQGSTLATDAPTAAPTDPTTAAPTDPSATPVDPSGNPVLSGVRGQTAADNTCTITNNY